MKFISTRHADISAGFEDALLRGLAPDGGLYVPEAFPKLSPHFLHHHDTHTAHSIGNAVMNQFLPEIPATDMHHIIQQALNFPIPLVHLEENIYLLEVFHGPTLAFKDVGARFMANTLAFFAVTQNKKINIIVATSGDTGSAIANAFFNMPNIDVYVLYPSKKISELQEKQITTFGGNIHALEVTGTFDDCQRLVKTALADESLKQNRIMTTANSINIARLLPQMIYHAYGISQLKQQHISTDPVLVVPSGNLGNLTSAIYAKRIGFDVHKFIAATNINAILPDYLQTAIFSPQPSRKTFANAMDVGNPSNFERLQHLYRMHPESMRTEINGIAIPDEEILQEISRTHNHTGYILDPHTAVGVAAARRAHLPDHPLIVTATAHPAKFPEVIARAINIDIELPETLQRIINKPKQAVMIGIDYPELAALLKA